MDSRPVSSAGPALRRNDGGGETWGHVGRLMQDRDIHTTLLQRFYNTSATLLRHLIRSYSEAVHTGWGARFSGNCCILRHSVGFSPFSGDVDACATPALPVTLEHYTNASSFYQGQGKSCNFPKPVLIWRLHVRIKTIGRLDDGQEGPRQQPPKPLPPGWSRG